MGSLHGHFGRESLGSGDVHRCVCQDRLQQVLEKSEPVTSEHIESTWAPAAITLKAWHLLDLSDAKPRNDPFLVPLREGHMNWMAMRHS